VSEAKAAADELLPLSELAKRLPCVRGRKPPHRATLYKWATQGLQHRSGDRVRLATQFVGGTRCASMADVERFFEAKKDAEWQPPKTATWTKAELEAMRRRGQAACERLKHRGF
jgi:hypothetical protein